MHLQSALIVVKLRTLEFVPGRIENVQITYGPTISHLVISGVDKFGDEDFKTHLALNSVK